jgi:hypothetical protein
VAFEVITSGAEVLRCGVELDAYRAEQARERIPIARFANHTQTPLLAIISSVETNPANAGVSISPSTLIESFALSSLLITNR